MSREKEIKSKHRLVRRLVTMIAGAMLMLAALVLIGTSLLNWREYKDLYNEKTMQIARTLADEADSEFLTKLSFMVRTEEFQKIRKEATEEQSSTKVVNWLKENDLLDPFVTELELLVNLKENMGARYVYIQTIKDGKCTTLVDQNEPFASLGVVEELAGTSFEKLEGNRELTPTISNTKYGWLSTGGAPIKNRDGEAIGIAFCDLEVTDMVRNTYRFAIIVACISLLAVGVVGIATYRRTRSQITDPIERLTQAAEEFGTKESGFKKENIVQLEINSGDEVEELYHATRYMQESIIDYMDNLTAVTAEKERIGAELDVANRIQASMLPRIFQPYPERTDFDIYASMDPAKEVGGDFYDFFLIDEDHLGIVIADVSGKGVPAALFMMMSKIIISNYAQMGLSPAEVLAKTNDRVCEGNEEEMFVTVWFGVLTISTGHVIAGNAGHEYPMLKKKNGSFEIFEDAHDFVIGGMEGMPYSQYEFDIEKGGTLFNIKFILGI